MPLKHVCYEVVSTATSHGLHSVYKYHAAFLLCLAAAQEAGLEAGEVTEYDGITFATIKVCLRCMQACCCCHSSCIACSHTTHPRLWVGEPAMSVTWLIPVFLPPSRSMCACCAMRMPTYTDGSSPGIPGIRLS